MFQARFAMVAVLGAAISAQGADLTKGTPDLKSAGALTFGPDGLLFIGDAQGAAIFAIDTADRATGRPGPPAVRSRSTGSRGRSPPCSGPTRARS